MKSYGKVIEYDGYCGTILSINGIEYLALKKDFVYENIKKEDIVVFIGEKVETLTERKAVARFIDKVEK